jgi:beta-N-acetylhexosaminidase
MSGLLAAALAGLLFAGGGDRSATQISNPLAMSDEQLAGARVVTGFSGSHPPAALRRMISAGQISGVILFDGNVGGRSSVRSLTAELQSIPRPAASPPLLVTVDQEGGLVRRLPGPPKPSARTIGARGAAFAERLGRATGESLRSMGINVDLAPVLDLGRPGRAIFGEGRTFARKPGAVSRIGVGFARGVAAGGVAVTAKHFPGLGDVRINTDNAKQRVNLPAATLRTEDERPFADFVAAGGQLVMLGTAVYPALSHKPAAFAHRASRSPMRSALSRAGRSVGPHAPPARRQARASTSSSTRTCARPRRRNAGSQRACRMARWTGVSSTLR